jgi:hypothetical protein
MILYYFLLFTRILEEPRDLRYSTRIYYSTWYSYSVIHWLFLLLQEFFVLCARAFKM